MNEVPKAEDFQRRERADEAKALMDNKAFSAAILALRKRYFEENQAAKDPRVRDEMWAKINALADIPLQLTILMNDEKMAQVRKK
jgi:hypothetical protein